MAAARRHGLTDGRWVVLESLPLAGAGRDRPRRWTLRALIDGIRWRVRTGSPWRDAVGVSAVANLVSMVSPGQRDGVWARFLALLPARSDTVGLNGVDAERGLDHQPCRSARCRSPL
ncbi:transposase [Micromonospora sp. KC723]|uniref:transposase n=1 Tax=Micromonospora sp. KC723 TaxID=2530381 RepID=UPI00352C4562